MTEKEKEAYRNYVKTGMTSIIGISANGPSGEELTKMYAEDPRHNINRDISDIALSRGAKSILTDPENNPLDIDKIVASDAKSIVQAIESEEPPKKNTRRKPRTNVKKIVTKGSTLKQLQEQLDSLNELLHRKDIEIQALQQALQDIAG